MMSWSTMLSLSPSDGHVHGATLAQYYYSETTYASLAQHSYSCNALEAGDDALGSAQQHSGFSPPSTCRRLVW
jgi:hypothetical protein